MPLLALLLIKIEMNDRFRKLAEQALKTSTTHDGVYRPEGYDHSVSKSFADQFAELIVEECRAVVSELYRKTPLELCGPLITADEEIAKHFYGVEK